MEEELLLHSMKVAYVHFLFQIQMMKKGFLFIRKKLEGQNIESRQDSLIKPNNKKKRKLKRRES